MINKWSKFFMNVAEETSTLSKDPVTKVGAVLVNKNKIKSTGYNGAPKTFPDMLVPANNDGKRLISQKNTYMCHAELNAILNYDGKLEDLENGSIYVTISPCSRCACILAQLGVKRVIYKEQYHREEEFEAAKYILDTCGVELIQYKDLEDN